MKSVWSVSKLSTESVGSRRQLVANYVHTADATSGDVTVSSRRRRRRRCVLGLRWTHGSKDRSTNRGTRQKQYVSVHTRRGSQNKTTKQGSAADTVHFTPQGRKWTSSRGIQHLCVLLLARRCGSVPKSYDPMFRNGHVPNWYTPTTHFQ